MNPLPLVTLVLVLGLAPLLPGVATRTRALLTGRRGAPVYQLYSDLAKLWRKGVVYSTSTTAIFRLAPVAVTVTAILAACLLPLDGRQSVVTFSGDLIAFASLLALGRFSLVLAGLDTGSSFEGMGASREVTFASFAEPALFLCLIALVRATGSLSLAGMLGAPLGEAWPAASACSTRASTRSRSRPRFSPAASSCSRRTSASRPTRRHLLPWRPYSPVHRPMDR